MGRLNALIGMRLYLDTSVIIYIVEKRAEYWAFVESIWRSVLEHTIEAVTSELSILETLVIPYRNGDAQQIGRFVSFFEFEELVKAQVSQSVLRHAARLRAVHPRLKTPDAIHLATAAEDQCDVILTNDFALRGIGDVPVMTMEEFTAKYSE